MVMLAIPCGEGSGGAYVITSIYEPGRRSLVWIKVRFSRRQEFVIGGYKPTGDAFDSVLVGYFAGRRLYLRWQSARWLSTAYACRRLPANRWNPYRQVPVRQSPQQHGKESLG